MGMLQKACGDSICEPAPMTLDTRLYTKTTDVTYNINVKPEGDFKPEDRQKLFDMLNAAAWTAMTCDVVKYRKETCPPSPMPGICILPDAEDKVICQAPKYWAVQLGDNSGNLMVSLDSSEDKSDQQWCEKMMGKGGEIAGKLSILLRSRTSQTNMLQARSMELPAWDSALALLDAR